MVFFAKNVKKLKICQKIKKKSLKIVKKSFKNSLKN